MAAPLAIPPPGKGSDAPTVAVLDPDRRAVNETSVLGLPVLNTALIALSSFSLHGAIAALRRRRQSAFALLLGLTLLLGAAFLALQWIYLAGLWAQGLRLASSTFGSYFYFIQGFHAAHVLVGVGLLVWLASQIRRLTAAPLRRARVRLVALFWDFVGVAWLMTFLLVYVL